MEEILIVDGYNMIGAWPELKRLKESSLEEARIRLLELLADYQAYTGRTVYVVFDAHQVPGQGRTERPYRLQVLFTAEHETADERIERLVKELRANRRRIYVATSDMTEQWVIFGQGALRLSARELAAEIAKSQSRIAEKVKERQSQTVHPTIRDSLKKEIQKIFERWRRE